MLTTLMEKLAAQVGIKSESGIAGLRWGFGIFDVLYRSEPVKLRCV